MKISRAVVTAAGEGQQTLPLQRLVDRDGCEKSALELIIEEISAAGVDEIAIVIRPADQGAYERAARNYLDRLTFIHQDRPAGYGQALLQAEAFAAGEPILHLVGDHLYLSQSEQRCARQLIDVASEQGCAVSAVQATRETKLPYYGAVSGRLVPRSSNLYEINAVLEKPTPTKAEQELLVPGLRAGYYLCFFGMHVLTPLVFEVLSQLVREAGGSRRIPLTEAMRKLVDRERYLALVVDGTRYDIGVKYGLLTAQLALSLSGVDREIILTEMVDLLATGMQATQSDRRGAPDGLGERRSPNV